jgi:sialic acid synthase SpsE
MVKAAAEAGADYVKIQSMLADDLTHRPRFESGIEEDGITKAIKRPYQAEYDRLKPLDLDDDAHRMFIEECKKYDVRPLTTVFNKTRIPFLASLPWPEKAIKLASFDCRSKPLIKELIAAGFKKFFISTGTTYDEEIKETATLLKSAGVDYTLLHCVSIYPTPLDAGHLERIEYLKQFSNSVGFSEHSSYEQDKLKLSIAALTYDIDVIERHFTVLPKEQTRDGVVSLNKKQLAELVSYSKNTSEEPFLRVMKMLKPSEYYLMKGSQTRKLTQTEVLNRDYYQGRFANHADGKVVYNWEE